MNDLIYKFYGFTHKNIKLLVMFILIGAWCVVYFNLSLYFKLPVVFLILILGGYLFLGDLELKFRSSLKSATK